MEWAAQGGCEVTLEVFKERPDLALGAIVFGRRLNSISEDFYSLIDSVILSEHLRATT